MRGVWKGVWGRGRRGAMVKRLLLWGGLMGLVVLAVVIGRIERKTFGDDWWC